MFKDNKGEQVYPVCGGYCSRPTEVSQGAETPSNNKPNKGTLNMIKVHTAEVYLTIQSSKEVFKSNKAIKIINHENGTLLVTHKILMINTIEKLFLSVFIQEI